eukprot:UN02246
MTCYPRPDKRPEITGFKFNHCEYLCGNAKQAADWLCLRMGFKRVAYKGLETGSRDVCSHVVQQNNIVMCCTSPLQPQQSFEITFIGIHGDAVRDIAFTVSDVRRAFHHAIKGGARCFFKPKEFKDENGTVIMAGLYSYGDTIHTLVQNVDYNGPFLPGFVSVTEQDPLTSNLEPVGLEIIDHCVGNQADGKMTEVADWYSKCLDFHQFWSVDGYSNPYRIQRLA